MNKKEKNIQTNLSKNAWKARENAFLYGQTKVGAALVSEEVVFTGCNVEQQFRSHDVHAEVNAIGNMVAGGLKSFTHILIVAERARFTPCGSCMDWIMQFGGDECMVGFQNTPEGEVLIKKAKELMPFYPH